MDAVCLFYVLYEGIIQKKYGRVGFFAKQKTAVPKARKMAAGGLGSAVSPLPPSGGQGAKPSKCFDSFSFKAR